MSDEDVEMAMLEAEEAMEAAVKNTIEQFSGVRTGRATPALFEKMPVEYYGADVPMQQLAGFSVPEGRTLIISPFDKDALGSIEKAIQQSDLGLNPNNDGTIIRISFPQLTAERRKDYVKVVKGHAEDGRIRIRAARRSARQDLEKLEKAGDISEDDLVRAEKELDKVTHRYEADIDSALAQKEQELLGD